MTSLPALPPDTTLQVWPNGLTVIVREDPSAPVVSAQAWCRAGSIHEGRWLGAGLSHVLEHMLFKGTTTRPGSRIDQEIQGAGGYMNAYTSFDRTVYWINVPNTGGPLALDILADIVQHATLPEAELARELEVIRRELDMCQDDPGRHASRRLFETAYTVSPYRYPIIGDPDLFSRLQRADIVAYYQEQYAPNNLFFVVVGDVEPPTVIEQIARAFADSRARPLPALALPTEPRQVGPREVIEEGTVELAHAHLAWHIPEVRHPDLPALDVLALVLGKGRSSRLFEEVRQRRNLAVAIEAWTYSPGGEGLFGVSGVFEAAKHPEAVQVALEEVERLQHQPVSAAELAKAVKQFTAGNLATRKTMQGQAQDLGGNWMAAHDLNFSTRYLEAVRHLTPEDLRRVAARYLTPENRTHYAYVPKGGAPVTRGRPAAAREVAVERFELANGLRLLVKPDRRLPLVDLRLVLRGGVLDESAQTSGLSQLLAQMLLQGTLRRSAEELASAIESVGGTLDTYSGNNSFGISAEVLSGDFALGLGLLAEALLEPAFPAEALERERQSQLAAIRAQRDHVLTMAFRAMRRTLFGPQGYGLDLLGEEDAVTRFTVEDLRAGHARLVRPDRAVLAVYGDIDVETVRAAVHNTLGAWPRGPATPALPTSSPRPGRVSERLDKKQAVLVLGFPGATLEAEDRFALELIQEACSDLGSRLFLRIRDQLGLAYFVGAQNFLGRAPGYIAFYAGTAPEKAEQVEQELLAEAACLRAEGLGAEELERAKAKVIGQKKIARQDLGTLAMTQALDELYGLGYRNAETEDARFLAVTREQTQAVAARYLRPELAVLAVVRPPADGGPDESCAAGSVAP